MDFLLSKIINRPKSSVDEPINNNNNDVNSVNSINNATNVDILVVIH